MEGLSHEAEDVPKRFREMCRRHIRALVGVALSIPGFLAVLAVSSLARSTVLVSTPPSRLCLLVIVETIYLRSTWSCPKCGLYVGQGMFLPGWDITHCRYCGVRLQSREGAIFNPASPLP